MNYLEDIYRLRFIKRYSNLPTIHEESVAEHGFFVAAIVMDLKKDYDFDLGNALAMAIAHDMPEIELNDCPHVTKKKYPAIAKAYERCEVEVAQELPFPAQVAVTEFNIGMSLNAKIVKMADVIQCIQYARTEIKLGNDGYMQKVLDNSLNRLEQLQKELKTYERG